MVDNGMVYFARANRDGEIADKIILNPKMANRHGFICGATGTGKTVTLKVLAESFSKLGVPVFVSDVKGDVAGLSKPGVDSENMQERIKRFELSDFAYRGYPVTIYDIYGAKGIPLRTTMSEMGPQLLSSILDLNDTQSSLLTVVFKIADDQGLIITDTKDLKAVLNYISDNANDFENEYGHIAEASVTTIIRAIVALESEGADKFFGEPAIDIADFFRTDANGFGMINILDAESLINKPRMYSAFMLYLLSELFEILPEIGDPEKPRMVFFFDEAHLLFDSASKALLEKIEQVVKLIRSKGVSIFFATQNPADIPNAVLAQLGNKIEHALRAYTPAEQKALRAAADSFRANENFNTEELLQNLGKGEAIVSVLDEKGVPTVAEHVSILPPESLMDAISDVDREALIKNSDMYLKYYQAKDEKSAYEELVGDGSEGAKSAQGDSQKKSKKASKDDEETTSSGVKVAKPDSKRKMSSETKSVLRTASGSIGREVGKTVGGALLGSKGRTIGGNIGASIGRNLFGTISKKK